MKARAKQTEKDSLPELSLGIISEIFDYLPILDQVKMDEVCRTFHDIWLKKLPGLKEKLSTNNIGILFCYPALNIEIKRTGSDYIRKSILTCAFISCSRISGFAHPLIKEYIP